MNILLLGSSGFVGRNIFNFLQTKHNLIVTSRTGKHFFDKFVEFDLLKPTTWENLNNIKVDAVINALAYGVIKHETDIETMYKVNYFEMIKLYELLRQNNSALHWIQIGTAFEYDLFVNAIDENSACVPLTHYGISKLMFSNYLFGRKLDENFHLLRPFAMFGPFEDDSKIIPALIQAQLHNKSLALSTGNQQRDYIYVENISILIEKILEQPQKFVKLINLGSGTKLTLQQIGYYILNNINEKKQELWQWGTLPKRFGEPESFFSNSTIAMKIIDKQFINQEEGIKRTVQFFVNKIMHT